MPRYEADEGDIVTVLRTYPSSVTCVTASPRHFVSPLNHRKRSPFSQGRMLGEAFKQGRMLGEALLFEKTRMLHVKHTGFLNYLFHVKHYA